MADCFVYNVFAPKKYKGQKDLGKKLVVKNSIYLLHKGTEVQNERDFSGIYDFLRSKPDMR